MVGTMPKSNDPGASADMETGQARRKQSLRNPLRPLVGEPQPHHRTTAALELPAWLPPAVASHAQFEGFRCQTESDELMLRRLTSDPRMKGVWTELLKRKRSKYETSDTFKYPATDRIDWFAASRDSCGKPRPSVKGPFATLSMWQKKVKRAQNSFGQGGYRPLLFRNCRSRSEHW